MPPITTGNLISIPAITVDGKIDPNEYVALHTPKDGFAFASKYQETLASIISGFAVPVTITVEWNLKPNFDIDYLSLQYLDE